MKRYTSQFPATHRYMIYVGISFILALLMASCVGEEMFQSVDGQPEAQKRAPLEVVRPGGLIQQDNGMWRAKNCRVPLVGPGRIVNDIFKQVDVISAGVEKIGNIVDLDLKNQYTVPVAVEAKLAYTPITSVKDLRRVYDKGQKVGFVYKDNSAGGASLLNVTLLKGLTLTTYLHGVKQESSITDTGSSLLSLDLLSVNSNSNIENRVISLLASKPFDEVVLGVTGVDLKASTNISLAVKYAFVGENQEIRATEEEKFKFFWGTALPSGSSTDVFDSWKLTDTDTTNYVSLHTSAGTATVDFNKEQPIGTEVGFCYSSQKLAGIKLFGSKSPRLTTYTSADSEAEYSNPPSELLGLSLIGHTKKTFVNIETKAVCRKIKFQPPIEISLLGSTHVFYAYVREGVKLDPANEYAFGNDTTYNISYRLPKSEKGTVQYQVLYSPYGSKPSVSHSGNVQMLDGLTHDGAYRIQALYTSNTDGRQVSHIATIYRKSESRKEGNIYITSSSHGAYAAEPLGWHGSLLSLYKGSNNLNNVVDGDSDNFATAYNLTSLLEWSPVASFRMNTPIGGGREVRTGFVVRSNTHLLDLTALSFYKIKLYSGNSLIYESGTSANSTVRLGLLGYDRDKIRLSVLTDKAFDRVELWTKGAATLMESLRIYNLFYEDSSCDATSEVGGGLELMTNVKDNLVIDYENTKLAGLLAVGQNATNLGNMLDGSISSGTLLQSTLSAGVMKMSFSFDKRPSGSPVGIILSEMPNLLNLGILEIGTLNVFNGDSPDPVATTDKLKDFKILGADLLSYKGRTYMEATPQQEYDRIEFTFGGVKLLENTKVCGVYARNIENDRGSADGQLTVNDGTYRTCFGSPLSIAYVSSSLPEGTKLSLYCENIADRTQYKRVEATLNEAGRSLVIPAKALATGRYNVKIYTMDGVPLSAKSAITAIVHPRLSEWKTNPVSSDWNEWDNWRQGSPWKCTDVIIPAGAETYPELSGTGNYCRNILFKSGSEVVGTSHLTVAAKAFVEMALQGGRNYLLSAPLQEMFTGDMFVNHGAEAGANLLFTPLDRLNYPEKRTSPVVYQRFWSRSAIEKVTSEDGLLKEVEVGTAQWSGEFNAVATRYDVAQGFSLRAGDWNDFGGYTFRFPKCHSQYHYWTHDGAMTGYSENVERLQDSVGRLNNLPTSLTLKNNGGRTFIMGNPQMCHLDISAFLKANPEVSHVLLYDGNAYNPVISVEGQLVSSQTTGGLKLAPMEACFVVARTAENALTVHLDDGMLCQKSTVRGTVTSRKSVPVLKISASSGSNVSSCVVVRSSSASDTVVAGEDVPLMTDEESLVSVFTLAEGSAKALSLQQFSALERIPIGFVRKGSAPVTLLFEAGSQEWSGWVFEDSVTGRQYPTDGPVELDDVKNGSGRYYLRER